MLSTRSCRFECLKHSVPSPRQPLHLVFAHQKKVNLSLSHCIVTSNRWQFRHSKAGVIVVMRLIRSLAIVSSM